MKTRKSHGFNIRDMKYGTGGGLDLDITERYYNIEGDDPEAELLEFKQGDDEVWISREAAAQIGRFLVDWAEGDL